LIWVLGGYSLAFGPDISGIIGNMQYFALNGVTGQVPAAVASVTENGQSVAAHIPFLAHFGYQEMFAIITPALITGAFADRVTFKAFLAFLVGWSVLVYLPFCHWVWGGGFLAKWGLVDYAGGIVVHLSAGIAALASVIFVGKRKLAPGETPAPHNIAFVALGTGLLWFGWFGFNAGSALAANEVAAGAFVTTHTAAAAAMASWLIFDLIRTGRPTAVGAATGAVVGLVAITPAAGFVTPPAAMVIGLVAAGCSYGAILWRPKTKIDDALDVFACHGVAGIVGAVLTGVFATKTVNPGGGDGALYGNIGLVWTQIEAVLATVVLSGSLTFVVLKAIDAVMGLRVTLADEIGGVDVSEHGEEAYHGGDIGDLVGRGTLLGESVVLESPVAPMRATANTA
jgi:Amt family ammonium transporter